MMHSMPKFQGANFPLNLLARNREQVRSNTVILLVLILLLGTAVRLYNINQPLVDMFSWREASTAMMADNFSKNSWNIFLPEVSWSGPGPSYQGREFQTVTYLSALLYTILGKHDWVGRFVALLFGVWGIFALFHLTRHLLGRKEAIMSAFIMAVMPGSLFIDRSFLPDPAMVSLVTTSFWMLVLYIKSEKIRYLIIAGIIGAWGISTKLPGIIIGLPMLYVWLRLKGRAQFFTFKNLLAVAFFGAVTLIPVTAYYFWARHLALTYPPHHFAGAHNWIWENGLQDWVSQNYFLPSLANIIIDWLWTWPIALLAGFGLLAPIFKSVGAKFVSDSEEPEERKAPFAFHVWLLAFAIFYAIGAQELIFNPWNFHIVNPAAASLAGQGILTIAEAANLRFLGKQNAFLGLNLRRIGFLVIITLLAIQVGFVTPRTLQWIYHAYEGESHQLGLALKKVSGNEDLVVTIANDIGNPIANYYSTRRGWTFPPTLENENWDIQVLEDEEETIRLLRLLHAEGADWLGIVTVQHELILDEHPQTAVYLKNNFILYEATSDYVIYQFNETLD